jgi:hypothetical protein
MLSGLHKLTKFKEKVNTVNILEDISLDRLKVRISDFAGASGVCQKALALVVFFGGHCSNCA